jgi:Fe-S cluster assembly protein SufD
MATLEERRAGAAERFASTPLPTTDSELWRYSRIAELDPSAFAPADDLGPIAVPAALAEAVGATAATVVVRNGHVVATTVTDDRVTVEPATIEDLALDATDAIGLWHDANMPAPIAIRIRRGAVVDAPILVVHVTDAGERSTFPHLVVDAGEDSEAVVVEIATSDAGVRAVVVPVTELVARDAARLRYVHAQLLGDATWQLGRQLSRVAKDATLSTAAVALGGDYARLRIESSMDGKGAHGEMLAVYFGERRQMHDLRTTQHHVAPNTTSNLMFKGAVEGHSHAVYTGLIRIGKQASGVTAFQTNRNIKLSDGAWAESIPNLEIENNDVRCSHASAVGPVDEDQRFYLESRGVRPEVAERLIVMGFFEEVLEKVPVDGLSALLRSEIGAKLERREQEVAG